MLQRAAIDAYSWWWASHTRTKQSKFLAQHMHDMEEKVEYILKIINEEGDSFAVRAEMYYRKRPELVNFVEDCFRNYRALAERYDHLSREFQSANRTIATVFPERVQMAMEEFDDETSSSSNFFPASKQHPGELPAAPPRLTIPTMVTMLKKNSKTPSRMMSRKGLLKMNSADDLMVKSSGLTKEEALREIDKLQKGILGFQTEKEFVKSTIESAMTKCCDIEKQVTEMQARVSCLEEEFGIGTVIEDDEARSIMASTALKSCKETLVKLQVKQEQMANEALVEHRRLKEAREKFEALKGQVCTNQTLPKEDESLNLSPDSSNQTVPKERNTSNSSLDPCNQTVPSEHESLHISLSSSNQMVPNKHESENPSPGPSNQTVHDEHESPNPSLDPSNQTVPSEHKSPHPSLRRINQMVPTERESPSPGPSNQTVPTEHKSQNLSQGPSNQTVPKEHESPNPNLDWSNQMVPKEQNYPNPSLDQSNQTVPKEHNYPNPSLDWSNQMVPLEDNPENLSLDLNPDFKESVGKERADKEMLRTKNKDQLLAGDPGNTVSELAENIDELVEKVINLETEVNSQSALVNRLRSEANQLEAHISIFKEGKEGLFGNKKTSELEEELCRVQSLDNAVIDQNKNLKVRVNEASFNLDILSEKLTSAKPDEEGEITVSFKEETAVPSGNVEKQNEKRDDDLPQKGQVKAVLDGIQEQRSKETEHTIGQRASAKSQLNGHLGSKKKGDEDKEIHQKEKNDNQSDQDNDLSAKNQDLVIGVGTDEEDQPNWRELFLNGLDDGERTLVEEYTSLLGNYKQVKKKLSEVENKNRASNFRNIVQIKVLKSANASKDEEIKALHKKLNLLITNPDENPDTQESTSNHESTSIESTDEKKNTDESTSGDALEVSHSKPPKSNKKRVRFLTDLLEEQGGDIKERIDKSMAENSAKISEDDKATTSATEEPHVIPSIEEKIRMDIDDLLEDNIEFWLRFSTSVHQIKKFQNSFQDLQEELKKVMGKRKKRDESSSNTSDSDLRATYRHLREIETELTLYMEHNGVLRDDLQHRLVSLCTIQEEITRLSEHGNELAKSEINDYQAAKFQGEVMNMKQENSKVTSELLTGLDKGKRLKVDIEKTMEKLDEELGISTKNPQTKNGAPRNKVPLRSFLFGVKLKKQKPSFFACISPQLQRQYSDLSAMPM